MTWRPHCDAARVARWRAIDRERAARSARAAAAAPMSPDPLPPAQAPRREAWRPRRFGRAADGPSSGGYRVLAGPRSAG